MAKKKSKSFQIDPGVADDAPIVEAMPHDDGLVSVNLKYFQKSCECFSKWQKDELKAFSGWIEKISLRTEEQIKSTTKTCHHHEGTNRKGRFSIPDAVSPEVSLYGLDVGSKARVHGFFASNNFFLLWLDRQHDCFK